MVTAAGLIPRARAAIEQHRGLVGVTAAIIAAGLALLWLFVVPAKADEVAGVQSVAVRYGHSVCWAFLAAASALYAVRAPRRLVEYTAWAALGAYAAFLFATLF